MAYGPFACKVLARWQGGGTGEGSVGYYVQRNSDNLVYYALAKYVMSKNGNLYPHLPIIISEIDRPPYRPCQPGSLAIFVTEGSNFYLNITDDFRGWGSSPSGDCPGCSDDENGSEASFPLAINGFAPASAYPDHYNSQVSTWIEALGSINRGLKPGSGGDAGQQIVIASYINPLRDLASWERP
jgi:hypothetical protein